MGMTQIPLALSPEPDPRLDNFLVADGGDTPLALHQLKDWLAHAIDAQTGMLNRREHAAIYLWGPQGSGKTHLLRAMQTAWRAAGGQVLCLDPQHAPVLEADAQHDLLILDDCDGLSELAQHRAFALYADASSRGVRVLAAGRLPPVDLPMREDLRTRLGWGQVLRLDTLTEDGLRLAMQSEARRRGLMLSKEVLDYILLRLARDLKNLMALLDRLDRYALTHQRAPTVPLLRQMLNEEAT